jgi:hypothetical protein
MSLSLKGNSTEQHHTEERSASSGRQRATRSTNGTSDDSEAPADPQSGSERCKLAVWRCLSGILETGIKYIEKPQGLFG